LHNPTSVAISLYREGVFDDQCCDEIGLEDTDVSHSRKVFFQKIIEIVRISSQKFWEFASVLLKYKNTVSIAQEFIKECSELPTCT